MRTESVSESIPPCVLGPSATTETALTGTTDCAVRPIGSDPTADENIALLVAALEEIESRRAALERLLEADLLRYCLV